MHILYLQFFYIHSLSVLKVFRLSFAKQPAYVHIHGINMQSKNINLSIYFDMERNHFVQTIYLGEREKEKTKMKEKQIITIRTEEKHRRSDWRIN